MFVACLNKELKKAGLHTIWSRRNSDERHLDFSSFGQHKKGLLRNERSSLFELIIVNDEKTFITLTKGVKVMKLFLWS
jgi:hypothetical protein